jgi:cyclase
MRRIRVIPTLLLKGEGLYKTLRFKDPKYVGDPINTVKLLNEKQADELFLLDITASTERRPPNFRKIAEVASEAFVPVGYGGGLKTVADMEKVLKSGVEKVILNTAAVEKQGLVSEAARSFGSQSVVVSIDAKKGFLGGYHVHVLDGRTRTEHDPVSWARRVEQAGAGEILINSMDRDGTFGGYDLELVKRVAASVSIPVIACGGASSIDDFVDVVTRAGASGVAAGSLFVFQKSRSAVLISFPSEEELVQELYRRI